MTYINIIIVDLPSVVCRKHVGIYDPCQYSCAPCWEIDRAVASANLHDQLDVYVNPLVELDRSQVYTGDYENTLFRFPLRQTPSQISDTLYDEARIENLFQMFQNEGHLMLLFLKNLEKITLYMDMMKTFYVQITQQSLEQLRSDRKIFLQNLKIGNSSYMINFVDIETCVSDGVCGETKWLVFQYYDGDCVSGELEKLKDEKNVPLVGFAFQIASKKNVAHKEGEVFCALPLPVHEGGITGLPFHVNGTFAVDQSRDHIKCPSADENIEICMDKSVLWNQYLLTSIFPKALVKFVKEAIQLQCDGRLAVSDVYRMIPNFRHTAQDWKVIESPFFERLFAEIPVFHTNALTEHKWFKWNDIVLIPDKDKVAADVLTKIMAVDQKYVTDAEHHLCEAFSHFHPSEQLEYAKPTTVIAALRKYQMKQSRAWDKEEHFTVLKYLLQGNQIPDLHGLELIPLADDSFGVFGSRTKYYLPLREEDQLHLMEHFEHDLIDKLNLGKRDLLRKFEKIMHMQGMNKFTRVYTCVCVCV